MNLLCALLIFFSITSTTPIHHRKKSPTLRGANRALEHLSSCCLSSSCRESQFSDLLSGLWNFAALSKETSPKIYYRVIEIAHDCRIVHHLTTKLISLRKTCNLQNGRGLDINPCFMRRVVLEFQAKRWNVFPLHVLHVTNNNNNNNNNKRRKQYHFFIAINIFLIFIIFLISTTNLHFIHLSHHIASESNAAIYTIHDLQYNFVIR